MSYIATCEDDDSSDSEQASQNDDELSSLLRIHSISEHGSSQINSTHNYRMLTELTSRIVSRMFPSRISAVILPLLKLKDLSK